MGAGTRRDTQDTQDTQAAVVTTSYPQLGWCPAGTLSLDFWPQTSTELIQLGNCTALEDLEHFVLGIPKAASKAPKPLPWLIRVNGASKCSPEACRATGPWVAEVGGGEFHWDKCPRSLLGSDCVSCSAG